MTDPVGGRIVRLEIENFKRIRAAIIEPNPSGLTLITGRNAQGKSTALDAVTFLIEGLRGLDAKVPVHYGEDHANLRMELEDIIIERQVDNNRKQSLKVSAKDGSDIKSTQEVLDRFRSNFAMDPSRFPKLSPAEQVAILLQATGQKDLLDALEAERQETFADRTETNREMKKHKALIDAYQRPDWIEDDMEVETLESATGDLKAAINHNRENDRVRSEADRLAQEAAAAKDRVERLERELAVARADYDQVNSRAKQATAVAENLKDIDIDAMQAEVAGLEERNELIRRHRAWLNLVDQYEGCKARSDGATQRIEEIDQEKRDIIAASALPIEGLTWDESGIIYDGFPFNQASQRQQLEVSVEIAMALNPLFKAILLRDINGFDTDGLMAIDEKARARGYQIVAEKMDESGMLGFVIEDGEVVARPEVVA